MFRLGFCYVDDPVIDCRVIKSDPGRLLVFAEPSARTGGQERAVNPQLASSPRLGGWTAEDYEGVSYFSFIFQLECC